MAVFAKSATKGRGFYVNMDCAKMLIRGNHVSLWYATAPLSCFEYDLLVIEDKEMLNFTYPVEL
jgi:hypothetical protein